MLIIIDLSGFKNVMQLLSTFQEQIKNINSNSIIEPLSPASRRYFAADLVNTMPNILRTNLLNGTKENQNGLIPRVNIDFHTVVIKK